MGDFPLGSQLFPAGACIHTESVCFGPAGQADRGNLAYGFNAWPAANRGIYIPFTITNPAKAQQMFWENSGVAGTTDIGIYDGTSFKRLVSLTATTNAGTIQVGNITDTILTPGPYFLGMVCSTTTTQTYYSNALPVQVLRMTGCAQQAIGSATLPDPMVPAPIASAFLPFAGISFNATI